MDITLFQISLLALIQGAAELLPVSSSAHVIVAEHLMGLDPSAPAMTFLLVMLHTGTMFAVLIYFWPRWKKLNLFFFKMVIYATAVTGFAGLGLKFLIEKIILKALWGDPKAEIEHLFKSLPLMSFALFCAGCLIIWAGYQSKSSDQKPLNLTSALLIGLMQAICLPFRGFSRSGATISAGLLLKIKRELAEDFSFALAVVLTPPVILWEFYRFVKASEGALPELSPGLWGMVFSFASEIG